MNTLKKITEFSINAGYQAVVLHKLSHWLWNKERKILAKFTTRINRTLTGIEIEPGAKLSNTVIISHGSGAVIGSDAIIGNNVVIRQNVTIGRNGKSKKEIEDRVHPIIYENVDVGAGAAIIGPITVGPHAVIGANAVITKDVPPYAVVAGVPGKILRYNYPTDIS